MKALITLCVIISLAAGTVVQKWHKSLDGSLYFIEAEQKYNWFEAWNECARKNMSLIAIDTYERHSQIDPLIRSLNPSASSPFWMAGHDNAVDKRYEWASTGDVFTFSNWSNGEPSLLPTEHCILTYVAWDWHDAACSRKFGFVCEENRLLKVQSKELATQKKEAQVEDRGRVKTFIWNNYNVNCGPNKN